MGVAVTNVEAGRLREPAAWLMIAIASTSVLVGVERLLFGGSAFGSSFGLRAAGYVDDFTSPVIAALSVGAVLLASHLGPVIARLKVMVYVAVATLGLAALFGVVGLLGGLFSGDVGFGMKIEFLLVGLPSLALAVLALLYLLPKAASAAGTAGSGRPQEHHIPQGGQAYSQGGHAQQGFQPQDQLQQGGPGYPQGFQPQDQGPQQGFSPQDQGPQQGFQPQDQGQQQGFQSQDQQGYSQGGHAQQGFQPQDQVQQGGPGYPQGFQSQDQGPQQGFSPQDQGPQQGFQAHEQQGYSQGGHAQQVPPAPQPSYSQPALPPARSSASDGYGQQAASEGYGQQAASDGYGQQQAHGYPPPAADGYPQAAYAPPADNRQYGQQAAPYAPAQPAPQALPAPQPLPAAPAETYTPSPYVAADVQPPAKPYEPPVTAYDPPVYTSPVEQQPQAPLYAEPQLPGYAPAADAQLPGYAQQPEQQLPGYAPAAEPQFPGYAPQADAQPPAYAPQPEQQQAPFYQAQPEAPAYQAQPEAPAPYAPADGQSRVSFDSQAQPSFPKPPENYGQPFGGYSGADFARPTEPNLHYPAPDPVDPRSQQMAQAYQQAESYQQQVQGAEPQLRVPEYGTSQAGGAYDDPFGHPQAPPAAQPYQQQGGHQWDAPADATLRFDPNAYQGDPLNDPNAGRNSWDSQPAIDPTAIYKPERSAQVTGEETPDRERVGPGQEQNMSWYGSDRREH
ncbi:hypothetical protein [Streptosporangium sp. NPDC003464]